MEAYVLLAGMALVCGAWLAWLLAAERRKMERMLDRIERRVCREEMYLRWRIESIEGRIKIMRDAGHSPARKISEGM